MYSIGVADVEHSGSKEIGAVESKLSEYLVMLLPLKLKTSLTFNRDIIMKFKIHR